MRREVNLSVIALLLACLISQVEGETVYFLVAEANTPTHGDSYILPLTDHNDIAHARDLIKYGPSAGEPIVVAQITCGPDYINRDYYDTGKQLWCWHVTEFVDFADATIEILDGWPGLVQNNCWSWMDNTGGYIGFWTYTVVAELGTDPEHWDRDFDGDNDVDFADFGMLAGDWRDADYYALRLLAEAWLSPFATKPASNPVMFSCWYSYECRYQCYGDADCATETNRKYRVYTHDLEIIVAIVKAKDGGGWPCRYYSSCWRYNPCADFDRDLDIDDDDLDILTSNWGKKDSAFPGPCPACQGSGGPIHILP